jgi:hypothetical protein
MDALLRYTLYDISITLLLAEISILWFSCALIIVIKWMTKWSTRRKNNIQEKLHQIINEHLIHPTDMDKVKIPRGLRQFRNLVEVLEKYDNLFDDPCWKTLKEKIISFYLLPKVKSYAYSLSWIKRQLAARSLLLCPPLASDALLEKLLDDPKYLVRIAAAICIIKKSSHSLFLKVITKMSQETALSQFPYRDALIEASQEQYQWMASLLSSTSDKSILAICLDVLSSRYSAYLLPLIKPFVVDSDLLCRTLAIKALGSISDPESIAMLTERLKDPHWQIRVEAIQGLHKLYATETIHQLQPLLSDGTWYVRLQAALALQSFGKKGVDILASQVKEINPLAYEIAKYALALNH